MVFSSPVFLFVFLPFSVLVYLLLHVLETRIGKGKETADTTRKLPVRMTNYWLLAVSFVYYVWNGPRYALVLLVSIAVNYLGGIVLSWVKKYRKSVLWLFVLANILPLFYFKYFNFAKEALNSLVFRTDPLKIEAIILPLGISFYSFSGISYLTDVYRKTVAAEKNVVKLSLYMSMFPKISQGPIVRYADCAPALDCKKISMADIASGAERIIIGLFKKVILADNIALIADGIYATQLQYLSTASVWIGTIAYTLQLYFDFSGYSDMAIGIARMLGFRFKENFNYPYVSRNISEFWRRWHISLSSFFRDYVYIPLGGNRKHVYLNLFIVFLLTGIWHGANYTFILWGIWNGLFILIERYILKHRGRKAERRNIPGAVLSHVYTLLVVNLGWVLFRSPDIGAAFQIIKRMFFICSYHNVYTARWWLTNYNLFILCIAVVYATPFIKWLYHKLQEKMPAPVFSSLKALFLLGLLVLCVAHVSSSTYSSFIYFQF